MPVQGTAADMMKLAMIRVHEKIFEGTGRGLSVRMLLQVHDEIVLEVKEGVEDEVVSLVEKEMVNVLELDVPVVVEVHVGKRWGELK